MTGGKVVAVLRCCLSSDAGEVCVPVGGVVPRSCGVVGHGGCLRLEAVRRG